MSFQVHVWETVRVRGIDSNERNTTVASTGTKWFPHRKTPRENFLAFAQEPPEPGNKPRHEIRAYESRGCENNIGHLGRSLGFELRDMFRVDALPARVDALPAGR